MKTRTLIISILGVLLVSGLSLSQEPEPAKPALPVPPTPAATPSQRPRPEPPTDMFQSSSGDVKVMKIIELRHIAADELAGMIMNVFGIEVYPDRRSNRLIVNATEEQTKNILSLAEAMDVEGPEASTARDIQNLVYRIYMFEVPSRDKDMNPFSMILRTFAQLRSTALLDVAAAQKIQVSDFVISDEQGGEQNGEQEVDILIQGKAPSNDSIKRMMENITNSQIRELKWNDDETFTRDIEAAHYSRLPAPIQQHIRNFLGENIETVGYWFGSSSVPGEIEAPIGPWMLHLGLSAESDLELELRVEVEEPENNSDFDRRLGRERSSEILSNTIRAKVGKPIIIGYNRQSYGTRKMGAMVIVPEADAIQL
jgi:hypothetical protein